MTYKITKKENSIYLIEKKMTNKIQTQYLDKIYNNKSYIKTVNEVVKQVRKLHKRAQIKHCLVYVLKFLGQ